MKELVYVLVATAATAAVLTAAAAAAQRVHRWIETVLTVVSTAIIMFAMAFVCAEVVMRYGFDSPIPGHLEGSELLVPIIVFFAISYTQRTNGHVGMSLVVDALSPRLSTALAALTTVLSVLICAVLAYFGAKYSYQLWEYDDVTMTPPYFRTWPSAAAVPLGYALVAMRMWFQLLHLLWPARFPRADETIHLEPETDAEILE